LRLVKISWWSNKFAPGRTMIEARRSSSEQHWPVMLPRSVMLGWLFLPAFSLGTALYAQLPSPGQSPDGMQSPGTYDCSDPLLAGTQDCASQAQQLALPLPRTQARSPLSGSYGTQAQNPNSNYSDIEQWSRQPASRNQLQQAQLPPEPLTEFQKFVASTTNQILPIYGAELFRRVPSTFAPLDMTPVPSNFVIGPGDELRIRVWGQVNLQANLRVDRAGEIYLPQVGPVHVAGLTFSALDAHLREAIGRVYRNFDLTADVGQIRAIQVYVAGKARRPGVYTVSSLSTLVDALFASGGPTVQGSLRHIKLRREGTEVTDFDLYDLLIRGDKSKDVKLLPGDVIYIPPVGPLAAVTGSVKSPAIYELRDNESLSSLLADAGGVSSVAAEARVSIERIEDHQDRRSLEVAYDADGDLVRVYSIVPIYRKTVILRGNTANPGRFAWHAGMHISNLIPDKESLITRSYWWKRAQLGLPAPEFQPLPDLDRLRQPIENHAITLRTSTTGETNYPNQRGYPQGQRGYQQGQPGYEQSDPNTPQGQSEFGQGQLEYQQEQNQVEQQEQTAYPQGQQGYQQNESLNAQQRAMGASLAATQSSNSSWYLPPSQRTEVKALAPEIDWDYAVIERLDPDTLKTKLLSFDLGKLVMQHEASQDIELQAGDVVTIFSEADIRVPIAHQTKTVTLDGEFAHAGVYTVQPGETLRDLVVRAGGLTPSAYLYGSEFTRESTRAVQQARIDEYVKSLGMEISRSNLALASSPMNSAQDVAGAASAQSTERELLSALRQVRATGRIVLRFAPGSSGVNSVPEISMEDGDRFVVPPVPATINVVGSVYDQNSFLFVPGSHIGMYLKLAGGPNRDADEKHIFVIRADGEVVSREREKSAWGNEFYALRMNAGDTIVVPEKTFKPSAMRGVLQWSQLFSQFALGAAAISVVQ